MPRGPADGLDIDERVGQRLLDSLERSDGTAELFAFAGVRGGELQCSLHDTDLDRAQTDERPGVEGPDNIRTAVLGELVTDSAAEFDVRVGFAVGRLRR